MRPRNEEIADRSPYPVPDPGTAGSFRPVRAPVVDDLVVTDGPVRRDEEPFVLLIEDGSLDVVPGEGTDRRLLIFPEGDEHQLGAVTTDPPKRQNTEVPGGRAVLPEPSRLQILEVLLGVGSAGGSPPEARDHLSSLYSSHGPCGKLRRSRTHVPRGRSTRESARPPYPRRTARRCRGSWRETAGSPTRRCRSPSRRGE